MAHHETMTMTTIDAIEERLLEAVKLTRRIGTCHRPHELALQYLYGAQELLDAMVDECEAIAETELETP